MAVSLAAVELKSTQDRRLAPSTDTTRSESQLHRFRFIKDVVQSPEAGKELDKRVGECSKEEQKMHVSRSPAKSNHLSRYPGILKIAFMSIYGKQASFRSP